MAEAVPAAGDGDRRLRHPASYFDLLEALNREGCAICRLAVAATDRYLDNWVYETFTDSGNRELLVRAGGFCTTHTWAVARPHATFQLAVAYRSVLLAAAQVRAIGSAEESDREGVMGCPGWWQRLFGCRRHTGQRAGAAAEREAAARWRTCPACHIRMEQEDRVLMAFAQTCGEPEVQEAFMHSSGFCLIHFRAARRACATMQPASVLAWLDEAQRTCIQRIIAQLDELIRKHDYRFSDEPQGEEVHAWRLAAELVAGYRGMW